MRKRLGACLGTALCVSVLAGCGSSFNPDTDTVYVQKKGTVISASVESFDKDYYDQEELQSYVNEEIESYTKENGSDTVELDEFKVEDEEAKLFLKFDTCDDYADFNGVALYQGSVVQAEAEGYDFDVDFSSVNKGEKGDGGVKKDTVTENSDYKVVVVKQNINVEVDGEILYVSTENTTVKSKNTVAIAPSDDAANAEETVLSYIIYK